MDAGSADPMLERLLLENLLGFWDGRHVDPGGGFRLAYDAWGSRVREPRRRLVSQARTTWFFARLARSPYGRPLHLEWAAHGFEYLRDAFWDPARGGFVWEIGAEGPTDERKQAYGQAFGLLALAELGRNGRVPAAAELAAELFELVDRHAHDPELGGYHECLTREWRPPPAGEPTPSGVPAGQKTANTQFHLLSAFAAFAEAAPGNRAARDRLRELLALLCDGALNRTPMTYPSRHLADWTPAPGWRTDFGHDVEAAWLAIRASETLGEPGAALMPVCEGLWRTTLDLGFDEERGGIYKGGPPGERADNRSKAWWAQAEGLVSARLMLARTGEGAYEDAFLRILDWIVRGQADWERGDYFNEVAPDGTVRGGKGGGWECPFHQGRALVECLEIGPRARAESA